MLAEHTLYTLRLSCKVKVKLPLCLIKSHVMKKYPQFNYTPRYESMWMSGGIAPNIPWH
jgi:hypothetical protein